MNSPLNLEESHLHRVQLEREWDAILRARGYGHSWSHWILGFEHVPYVPQCQPEIELLQAFLDITRVDCDASCRQESLQRHKSFAYAIKLDNSENFGSLTYKIMRDKSTPKLEEVPYSITQQATLCRASKGVLHLRLDEFSQYRVHSRAVFGEAEVDIESQNGRQVTIKLINGVIPSKGILKQKCITKIADEVFEQFTKYWTPFWLRDQTEEQFQNDSWTEFLTEMDTCNLPDIALEVDISDPQKWKDAIKGLKPKKSEGVCGWRHEELQSLPFEAIRHLSEIFTKIWPLGLPKTLMQARTILLAKVDKPEAMHHGRPITILSTLYRLASKIVFDQVISQWARILPFQISGGLPRRGVRDVSLMQSTEVERALLERDAICGTSMDLSKAFNLIPRRPAALLLNRLGVPWNILQFWVINLANMVRLPFAYGQFGTPVGSTTGVPEGDAWSVLCMIAISTMYYFKLRTEYTVPFAFADNWSWVTRTVRDLFRNWVKVLNLVAALRMKVDPSKSWVWATSPQMRKDLQSLWLLFPGEDIQVEIKTHVKDLGEIQQYNRQAYAEPILERIKKAVSRVEKLKYLPISIQDKAKRIQSGAWSFGLYGADTHFVSPRHFVPLRRAVIDAFVGDKQFASPWLTLTVLSKYIMDPLLYVVVTMIRLIRRCYTYYPTMAQQLVRVAANYEGKIAYGPATSLKKYLQHIGWTIHEDGTISGAGIRPKTNCFHDSSKELMHKLSHGFRVFAQENVSHRKGIGPKAFDYVLTRKVFSSFSDTDQVILANNMIGGFQNETIKAKWDDQCTSICPLCDQVDHQGHRFLNCPKFEELRSKHKEAVEILSHKRPDWVYHPIAHESPDIPLFSGIHDNLQQVEPAVVSAQDKTHHRYYTDGACSDPTNINCRRSGWAVIQDITDHNKQREDLAAMCSPERWQVPKLQCLVTGLTHGNQSAARAELCALLEATRHAVNSENCITAEFIVDAQYVINVVGKLFSLEIPWHKIANSDLVKQLRELWTQKHFTISKIKSHRSFEDARDFQDLWDILGNYYADKAAGKALANVPQAIQLLANNIRTFCDQEKHFLTVVLTYICELNKARSQCIKDSKDFACADTNPDNPDNAMHNRALETLCAYDLLEGTTFVHDTLEIQTANANLQGADIALDVWWWASQLKWPSDNPDIPVNSITKWGVTWFELLVSFVSSTGHFPPLRVEGLGAKSVYVEYQSDEGKMQLQSKRAAAKLTLVFMNLIQCVQNISGHKLFPIKPKKHSATMSRLGFQGKNLTCLPIRPMLPNNDITVKYVKQYIDKLEGSSSLRLPIDDIPILKISPEIQLDNLEACPAIRYSNYQKLVKKRSKED